jgi:ABC-2 type transport system ATP-binding protein
LGTGTICGLLGANGAGKSTLLRLLAGLSFPRQGSCRVLGYEPARREPQFLSEIFLLPEEVSVPPLTAAAYGRCHGDLYPRFDHGVFERLLAEFALPQDRRLTTFSLGQKKKFLLAFGIATGARLMILDEPTNGLDLAGKARFRRALIEHFSPERSFLISTHQVHDLQGLIDAVVIIAEGGALLGASLDILARRLSVEIAAAPPEDALYVEESVEGFRVIRENHGGVEHELDLELLFGLATQAPDTMRALSAQEDCA